MHRIHRQIESLTKARKRLRRVAVVTDVYYRGYEWLRRDFLPALRILARSSHPSDRSAASVGYYVLGDVHDFNGAPRAAIRAYLRSARLCRTHGAPWREIGLMYDLMGERDRGLQALRKAVRVDPSDDTAQSDLESMENYALRAPFYRADDPCWQSAELLASSSHQRALAVIARKRSQRASRYRARIYGAMGKVERVIETWRQIMGRAGPVEIESADWFFLPKAVWDCADFWSVLSKGASRIEDWGVLKGHDTLTCQGISGRKRFQLFLRYHLARTRRDLASARKLSLRHPYWREAATLVKRLGGGRLRAARE